MASIRELVVANLSTALETLAKTVRIPTNVFEVTEFPTIAIYDLSEDMDVDSPVSKTNCHLHVDLHYYGLAQHDVSLAANTAVAEVNKVIRIDPRRGGNAIHTHMVKNTTVLTEEVSPYYVVVMNVDIIYRFKNDDPYAL